MTGVPLPLVSAGGSAPTLTIYWGGDDDSHWEVPANTEIFDNLYVSRTGDTMSGDLTSSASASFTGNVDVTGDITAASYTGAVVEPTRLDVKQDTKANLETYAATATNGQLVFATDEKKMYQVLDGALSAVGGGACGVAR